MWRGCLARAYNTPLSTHREDGGDRPGGGPPPVAGRPS